MDTCYTGTCRAVGNDHFCDTTKRASQTLTPHIQRIFPCITKVVGQTPSDPTTLGFYFKSSLPDVSLALVGFFV